MGYNVYLILQDEQVMLVYLQIKSYIRIGTILAIFWRKNSNETFWNIVKSDIFAIFDQSHLFDFHSKFIYYQHKGPEGWAPSKTNNLCKNGFWRRRCLVRFWWSCFIMHFRCWCAFRASSMIVNWSGNKTKNYQIENFERGLRSCNSWNCKQDFQRIIIWTRYCQFLLVCLLMHWFGIFLNLIWRNYKWKIW